MIFAPLGNLANYGYYGVDKRPICTNKVQIFQLTHYFGDYMIDNQTINQLSEQINALLPPGLLQVKEDFDARLKSLLQQQLTHFEMVSREEFDIQARVLARTREKLEVIEARLKELEKTLD